MHKILRKTSTGRKVIAEMSHIEGDWIHIETTYDDSNIPEKSIKLRDDYINPAHSKLTYGLSKEIANKILNEGPEFSDYFEAFVMATRLPELVFLKLLIASQEDLSEKEFREGLNKFQSFFKKNQVEPESCAKFIMNELVAAAKRNKIEATSIPLVLAVMLLLLRKSGLVNNIKIKEILDDALQISNNNEYS